MPKYFVLLAIFYLSCGNKNNLDQKEEKKSIPLLTDFKKPKGISFQVDSVEILNNLMQNDTAVNVFEMKIGKKILFCPEEHSNLGLVRSEHNGLISTLQECYDNHRPLVLTPDAVWLTICQGVSMHINQNYKLLKNQIFINNKPDKVEIRIQNDSLEYGAKHLV